MIAVNSGYRQDQVRPSNYIYNIIQILNSEDLFLSFFPVQQSINTIWGDKI